ncbi:ABC transporter ATP-binding protein [Candidatus Bathyarchaeota archaeon]|nr:ABC transporter ATP-binding protein [Candidatus Bathyarchaeota archaeon]
MSKAAIETVNLVKQYPAVLRNVRNRHPWMAWQVGGLREIFSRKKNFIRALNGVNLKIYRGEVFGLLGPNGAGKTTLIKILCTLVLPDGGEAYVNGYNIIKEPSRVLRNLQAVLGDPRGFDWRLSAKQNLEFYATLYGLPRDYAKKRVEELLDLMGLSDRANDMYQRFSTGMARKLQLCRALLLDTPIILFDEPTAGLDPASAVDFRHLLKDELAKSEGRTIFIATHNMWEAQTICDRVAIINRGEIIAWGSPENLKMYISPEKNYVLTIDGCCDALKMKEFMNEAFSLTGVKDLRLQADNASVRISIRVDKDFVFSEILDIMVKYGLKIKDVESYEPSLEEVFIALIRGGKRSL